MEAIGYSAFDHCQNLGGQLVIPAEVTSIGNCAFAYTKVTSLSFAENSVLETIGSEAFSNCTDLEFAVIPASVSSIGGVAFSVCNHLSTIVVLPATPPVLGDQAFLALGTNTVYVGDLANYPEGWGGFKSVKSVGELEGTIKDDALAAISQAAQGMELYDEETAIIQGYVNTIAASGNFIEILKAKTDALQYISLHSQRVTAISAIDAAMQGMTLTPTETTVVNGHKAQILASVSVYAIEAVRAEAAESMADSQIWVGKNFHVGVGAESTPNQANRSSRVTTAFTAEEHSFARHFLAIFPKK